MVRLLCPLYLYGRMIPAGEEMTLPGGLEAALLRAGNAEKASLLPAFEIPAAPPDDPFGQESPADEGEEALEGEISPLFAPVDEGKSSTSRRYGRGLS